MHEEVTFQRTAAAMEAGIEQQLHTGAQLYISRQGQPLVDTAFGEARPGVPMSADSITLWLSAGKPLTAAAIAVLVEQGQVSWDTPIAEVIPAFGAHGKSEITLAHVLTHTAGLHVVDDKEPLSWDERIARICEAPLPDGWVPGEQAAYSPGAGWFILGEVIRLLSGGSVNSFVVANVCRPLAMNDAQLCMDAGAIASRRNRLAWMHDTSDGTRPAEYWNNDDGLQRCAPGGSARGPARELGKFYEALLGGGTPILKRPTIEAMTARQREGLLDQTFQYRMDWGYGFILNSNRDGFQMPYGYGRDASPQAFGHSGNQSSCAFADPENMLVVAWVTNGMPGERRHQQRQRSINNAIYEDLNGG